MTASVSEQVLDKRQRCKDHNIVLFSLHNLHGLGAYWLSLTDELYALQLRIPLLLIIFFHSLQELLIASRLPQMFNADVEALAQLSITNLLCHFNTNGTLIHIENDAAPAMIERIRHTL